MNLAPALNERLGRKRATAEIQASHSHPERNPDLLDEMPAAPEDDS